MVLKWILATSAEVEIIVMFARLHGGCTGLSLDGQLCPCLACLFLCRGDGFHVSG